MGLFDFVENFFFIGLALLFVLVLLLVYHFKQRMNSVEKKGDNMYDLLTNVVRELRNIRTNVISGGNTSVAGPVSTKLETILETDNKDESEYENDDDDDTDNAEQLEESDSDSEEDGITYQIVDTFSGNEKRMVVSDESSESSDSDSESDMESESDSESESEPDNELSNPIPVETYTEEVPLETQDVYTNNDVPLDVNIVYVENPIQQEEYRLQPELNLNENMGLKLHAEEVELELELEHNIESSENDLLVEVETVDTISSVNESANLSDDIQPISRGVVNDKLALYKKMNVNQLKALAIQNGIQGDTSKLKKNALIDFLVEKQV